MPPPFDHVGQRPFSFYPPILNVEHNEWILRRATWSEVLVFNTRSETETWIPRRFFGEVSQVDEPVMIVGLVKELEYKSGSVWPHERRVIEMPRAVNDIGWRTPESAQPAGASVVGIRLEGGAELRIGKLIGGVMVAGIAACVLVVSLFRSGPLGSHVSYTSVLQSDLGLTAQDDYYSVVRKLGTPTEDRWKSDSGELQYRALTYPQKSLMVILMGEARNKLHYIGALDKNWKPVHSVPLGRKGNTASMLAKLPRF